MCWYNMIKVPANRTGCGKIVSSSATFACSSSNNIWCRTWNSSSWITDATAWKQLSVWPTAHIITAPRSASCTPGLDSVWFRWNLILQRNSLHPNPSNAFSLSVSGCKDRLFMCPSWAQKGFCEKRKKLMKKHCPSTCDFCYGIDLIFLWGLHRGRRFKLSGVCRDRRGLSSTLESSGGKWLAALMRSTDCLIYLSQDQGLEISSFYI